MPCGNMNFGKCYRKVGRLAYLNQQEKPNLTKDYASEDARARAIRRRVGRFSKNGTKKNYGPLFGVKKNLFDNSCNGKETVYYTANSGDASDVTFWRKNYVGSKNLTVSGKNCNTTACGDTNCLRTPLVNDDSKSISEQKLIPGNIYWAVEQWNANPSQFKNGGVYSQYCSIEEWDTSKVTNMQGLFRGWKGSFNGYIGDWDVGNVTDMNGMFALPEAGDLVSIDFGNLSKWDTSQVTDMRTMFIGWSGGIPRAQEIGAWNTSSVKNMNGMFNFSGANYPGISAWNTSSVTNMVQMFEGSFAFNADISIWDVSNVTDMGSIFADTDGKMIKVPNLSAWATNGTGFNSALSGNTFEMFRNSGVQTVFPGVPDTPDTIPVSRWESYWNTPFTQDSASSPVVGGIHWAVNEWISNPTQFQTGGQYEAYGTIDKWNTTGITNMDSLFENRSTFNDNIGGWDVSDVTSMINMFKGASIYNNGGSTEIDTWDVSKVTDMSGMFNGATAFNQPLNPGWPTVALTNTENMFRNATSYNQPLNAWDVSNVTTMFGMFFGATSFDKPLDSWITSSATNMSSMFRNAIKFNQNIGSWDVSAVTNMSLMFMGSSRFDNNGDNSIGTQWQVGNVATMAQMFQNAIVFKQDISSWDVSKVRFMNNMFLNTPAFKQNLQSWPNNPSGGGFNPILSGNTGGMFTNSGVRNVFPRLIESPVTTPLSTWQSYW